MVFFFIFFFIFILLFPEACFTGAQNGLLIWFQNVLPTLLPYIILSNILVKTNVIGCFSIIVHPFLHKLFFVSPYGCYAIIAGFFCGYPMGAKVIHDLLSEQKININEAQYLLSFCNNTSPMFIINFVILQNFKDKQLLLPTLFILYLSPILCSFLFRRNYVLSEYIHFSSDEMKFKDSFSFSVFDEAIMNGFSTITKIGGYIILFSILFMSGNHLPIKYLLPYLEISNGIPFIMRENLSFTYKYILILSSISFGGLCSLAQTYSMIQDTALSIYLYIKEKLITTMVTSLLAYLYTIIILP